MDSEHRQGVARPAVREGVRQNSCWRRRSVGEVTLLAIALTGGRALRAQQQTASFSETHPQQSAQLAPRDSLRYLAEAQHAQSAFERYRRAHLPRNQPSAVKPCDAQIGRFCYWHTPDDFIPAEPGEIATARERLLRTLDALNERSRGDDWISGQRVRYLIEAGYDSSAVVASRECWSAAWWCGVLRGFALHASQRYAESETVFDSAIAKMPAAERCHWTDISLLLTDEDRARYEKLTCDAPDRNAFEQRFWQLADTSRLSHPEHVPASPPDTTPVPHANTTTHIRMIHAPWKGVVVGVERYDGTDTSAVTSLHDALHRAITTDNIHESRKVGIYWETYDTTATTDTTAAITLTVTRTDGNIFSRLAQTLHLSTHNSPLLITWHDIPATPGLSYRSVVLDLHDLPSGTYHLELATGPDATHRTVATRDISLH